MNFHEAAKAKALAGLEGNLRSILSNLLEARTNLETLMALVSAGPSSPAQDRSASAAPASPSPEGLAPAPEGQPPASPQMADSSRQPGQQDQSGSVLGSPCGEPDSNAESVKAGLVLACFYSGPADGYRILIQPDATEVSMDWPGRGTSRQTVTYVYCQELSTQFGKVVFRFVQDENQKEVAR